MIIQIIKKILKKFIPPKILNFYKTLKQKKYIEKPFLIQEKYKKIEKKLKRKCSSGYKLKIGFYVIYDSSWGARPLFEYLLNNNFFDVKLVLCPDTSRGNENQNKLLNDSYIRLKALYGENNVINSYDNKCRKFKDYIKQFDIISFENPYDSMTFKYYKINYAIKHNKLTFFNSYAYQGKLKYDIEVLIKSDEYSLFWKLFVDNPVTVEQSKEFQKIKGANVVLSGYCKMDKFIINNENHNKRKTIMIAPHHTVQTNIGNLHISNFLSYSDFFLELPALYPNIDFIFRPHPLLYYTLCKKEVWGPEKTNLYFDRISSFKNVTYSYDGEYFSDFNKSDALIDDCGSFLAEYFYTNKPQCYLLKEDLSNNQEFSDFGKELFNYIYTAYNQKDIIYFIDEVVLKDNDYLFNKRKEYANKNIIINYPNVSSFIYNYIKNIFYK